ncbi:MAG: ATP-binding cassette domain-containing protein [Saprospiraceae bacterium]|nr:ATP-binding cassette domain-containing protein [Saprospiraceae bacterium]
MNPLIVQLINVAIDQGDQQVLSSVNMEIREGEFIYLVGKTGSGKSSLLKALYGAVPITSGKGTVAGFSLDDLNRKSIPHLRRKLGIVFQEFNLLPDRSIFENLKFVLKATQWKEKKAIDLRIMNVLESVDLASKRDVMPHQLSGGEQQRVAIGRALLNNPQLIIADEPTGNLDPETSDDILLLLRRLVNEQKVTVLLATHDYRMLEHFPGRIIRCVNGMIFDDQEVEM